jgi:hypothetical protein
LDEISQGPKRDFRWPSARWLVLVAAVGLAAAITTLALTGGGRHHSAVRPKGTASLAAPAPSPTAAAGTVLMACDPATQNQLAANWRRGSMRAGPLWFVANRQLGYVHASGWHGAGRATQRRGKFRLGEMLMAVMPGSIVVMKPATAALPYFHFVDGFGPGTGYRLPSHDTGFTFAGCPRESGRPESQVSSFDLGFSMEEGRSAPAEVWPSPKSRPIRVIFTCPGRGTEGC